MGLIWSWLILKANSRSFQTAFLNVSMTKRGLFLKTLNHTNLFKNLNGIFWSTNMKFQISNLILAPTENFLLSQNIPAILCTHTVYIGYNKVTSVAAKSRSPFLYLSTHKIYCCKRCRPVLYGAFKQRIQYDFICHSLCCATQNKSYSNGGHLLCERTTCCFLVKWKECKHKL